MRAIYPIYIYIFRKFEKCNVRFISQNDWGSGYGFVLYSLTQIQVLCFLGTIISTQVGLLNDDYFSKMLYVFPKKRMNAFAI